MTTLDLMTPRRHLLDPADPRFAIQVALFSFVVVVHSDVRRAIFGMVVAVVGLLITDRRTQIWFWWLLTAVMTVWFIYEWPTLDNHVALSVYWAGAIAFALSGPDWEVTLARLARWMIVTVFGLAVFWKLASADFISGGFFEWTLVVDPRFAPVSQLLGMSGEALAANRETVVVAGAGELAVGDSVRIAAQWLTWGTLALESAVAILWGLGERVGKWRHLILGLFALTTYAMVPVVGFGFMLLVMGLATVSTSKARLGYASAALALFIYAAVWNRVVLG